MSVCACMGPIPGTNVCQCGRVFGDATVNIGVAPHTPDWNKAMQDRSQPAPQGVAQVMALVDAYALAEDGSNRESIEQAITALMQERDALKADNRLLYSGQLDLVHRLAELEVNYHELLYAVAHKHPDETRHQTALRYIMRAEKAHGSDGAGAASSKEPSRD